MSGMKPIKRENSFSQLNVFKESKKEISKIFGEISDYVIDSNSFFQEIYNSDAMFRNLITAENTNMLMNFVDKVTGIQNVINRDSMKCAFFGRTSNGKSTTINAMLGGKILPAGIGHTTSCFLEIRGTKDNQGCMSISNPNLEINSTDDNDLKPVDSVKELARDVCSNKLSTDSLIKIYWPNEKCSLLSEDVVILDSPGIDVDPDIDKWIDMYCLDADVFVLVANSEATLNITEKAFFHKVRSKLSKPNIFILNNRWDASAEQLEYVKEAREQHLERCVNFLTKELKVCSKTEAESRVFFVSASEALSVRSKKNDESSGELSSLTDSPGVIRLREGWQSRLFEFTSFEKNLEKTLSESATKTKFAAHSSQGQEIVSDLRVIVENLNEKAQEQKDAAVILTHKMRSRSDKIDVARKVAHKDSIAEIARLVEKVTEKVADVLREEIRRLGNMIDDFDHTFYEDVGLLSKYKVELSQYVNVQLAHNLTSICSQDLCKQVESLNNCIIKRYLTLVQDKDIIADRIRTPQIDDFSPNFYIDCDNISSDFHEDLSFKFSWGPSALLGKLIGPISPNIGVGIVSSIGGNINNTNGGIGGNTITNNMMSSSSSLSSLLAMRHLLLPTITGRTVIATILIGGLLLKATGWKVLGACAGIYGTMYAYEYSTWTTRAKERAFKQQFRTHVSTKLEIMMTTTSKNSAVRPHDALNRSLKRLNGIVDDHINKLRNDITRFDNDIKRLDDIVSNSRSLKNKAFYLEKVLKSFHDKYILA